MADPRGLDPTADVVKMNVQNVVSPPIQSHTQHLFCNSIIPLNDEIFTRITSYVYTPFQNQDFG